MLLSGTYANPHELARFTREAEAVASLRHANIVQIYDVGEFDFKPYFTMEFMDGGSLAQKLAGTPQPASEAASLTLTLATAAHVAHLGGIVHRDLKPSNILITTDGMPKISDFGLARRISPDSTVSEGGAHVGTPSYMAPEQALGKSAAIGPRTDVYALGAILYELLTGRPPFRAESASETERQLISREPAPPRRLNAKIPRDLETICLKCLRKDPDSRYATAEELADDLRRFIEGRPIVARPIGWPGRVRRWARREPATACFVATLIALVALAITAGFWVQGQRAITRATDERQRHVINAALAQSNELRTLGHWPEALHALEGAPALLATSAPEDLRQRLQRARGDADMVVHLEDIRLRLSEGANAQGGTSPLADRLYREAFANYGISLSSPDPANTSTLIRHSDIRDILLVFLHDWLYWAGDDHRARLRAIIETADDDPWRRAFRDARAKNDVSKLKSLALAPEAASEPPALLSGLGGALLVDGHRDEAWTLLRTAYHRYPGDFWINYLLGQFLAEQRPQEAVGYFRAAVAIRPRSDQAYSRLGRALRAAGDSGAAIDALQAAIALNPSTDAAEQLVELLFPRGHSEEARLIWQKNLRRDPFDHASWFGYPQLCLFLGNEAEFRWARDAMYRHFEFTNDWIIAERTSQVTLLQPLTGDDLRRAVALADRAVTNARKSSEPDNAYVKFIKGLAEYRAGNFEQAIPYLEESAAKLPDRPGSPLVLAMVQYRLGSPDQARKTLAQVVAAFDWKESNADHPGAWMSHILRREAESLILPNLHAFLEGKYQPIDNDERLALLGVCQSRNLHAAAATILADAFAADPSLADRLTAQCSALASRANDSYNRTQSLKNAPRLLAARSAALAGSGICEDRAKPNEADRQHWREQSRRWLEEDLDAWTHSSIIDPVVATDVRTRMLTLWQSDPDLAPVRDPEALAKLPPNERANWGAFWKKVMALIQI
jgi:serine/threonine-protein kinase